MYSDSQKEIFTLPNGRSYDPIRIRRHLLLHSQDQLTNWITVYNDGVSEIERAQAEEQLVIVTRKAFGLTDVTEQGGVGDGAVLQVLASYLEFLSVGSKVTTDPNQISRPCTDCHPVN